MKSNGVSMKEYIDQRFEDSRKAVDVALSSSEKAVEKAETNTKQWQNSANEWRSAMNDRERNFLTRREFYIMIGTVISMITLLILISKFFWK